VEDYYTMYMGNYILSAVINVVNIVLKAIAIIFIYWIGEDTKSERTRSVMIIVFLIYWVNTAIILLLVEANTTEFETRFGWSIFGILDGAYTDFDDAWYQDVGALIVST